MSILESEGNFSSENLLKTLGYSNEDMSQISTQPSYGTSRQQLQFDTALHGSPATKRPPEAVGAVGAVTDRKATGHDGHTDVRISSTTVKEEGVTPFDEEEAAAVVVEEEEEE